MKEDKNIVDFLNPQKGNSPDASYFEQLAKNVILQESMAKKRITPFYKKPVVWLVATAASIVFILLLNVKSTEGPVTLLAMNDISTEEIRTYIDANIDEFDTYLLSEFVSEESVEESKTDIIVESPSSDTDPIKELEEVDLDDILDYLELEEIDIEDLEDELYI
ncbi:MAG: hypothetical protein COA33_007755 [Fluviicola sp.]|nr:hypothetical protein [Fluviicola sp.]